MKHVLTLDARGHKRTGETPLICTPLVGRTRDKLLAEVAAIAPKSPDLLEWRVDHFGHVADTHAVLDTLRDLRAAARELPMIFTCRAKDAGGHRVPIDREQIGALYERVAETGAVQFVDLEVDHDPALIRHVRQVTHAHEVRLILSYHNSSYTPGTEHLIDRFLEAERLGADVAMVQVRPRNRVDVLRLLMATAEADTKAHIPLISMSIGPLGAVSRIVGGLFGSTLSFAVGERASAPGQVPIGDLVAAFDVLRRARGGEMY